jgi:hypothetical protein
MDDLKQVKFVFDESLGSKKSQWDCFIIMLQDLLTFNTISNYKLTVVDDMNTCSKIVIVSFETVEDATWFKLRMSNALSA